MLRNVPESDDENTVNKATAAIVEGRQVRNVKVVKAERKRGHGNRPGLIVARLENEEQKHAVLK